MSAQTPRPDDGPRLVVRVTIVAGALAGLLAVAVVLLVVGRAVPVRAAGVPTRTVTRASTRVATGPARAPRSANGIVPPGLPQRPRRGVTEQDHRARDRAAAHERAALRRLRRQVAAARARARDLGLVGRAAHRRSAHRHGYNPRPRARSSAG